MGDLLQSCINCRRNMNFDASIRHIVCIILKLLGIKVGFVFFFNCLPRPYGRVTLFFALASTCSCLQTTAPPSGGAELVDLLSVTSISKTIQVNAPTTNGRSLL